MSGPRRRRRSPFSHPDAQAFLASAHRMDEAGGNRKHHLVPATYLRQWGERVRVTEVDKHHDYVTSPDQAARETDFYRIARSDLVDDIDVPELLIEAALSLIEGRATGILAELTSKRPALTATQIEDLALFMALQFTRGRAFREERRAATNDLMRVTYRDVSDEWIRSQLERSGHPATDALVADQRRFLEEWKSGGAKIVPRDTALIGEAFRDANGLVNYFTRRAWVLYRTRPVLVTCDEPVVLVGGPGLERGQRAGLELADLILFPLSPELLLVMVGPGRLGFHEGAAVGRLAHGSLDTLETAQINLEIAANCSRWVFERPEKRVAVRLSIPHAPPEAMTTEEYERVDGARLIRTFKPNRWSTSPCPPPWPVARWWS